MILALPQRSAAQEEELYEASERLEVLGVSRSHPNPLFDLFAKAIAELQNENSTFSI
jgi:glycosyltransferase involved in cell wall biosynthesis